VVSMMVYHEYMYLFSSIDNKAIQLDVAINDVVVVVEEILCMIRSSAMKHRNASVTYDRFHRDVVEIARWVHNFLLDNLLKKDISSLI
jgi:hypothetical protein